MGRGTGPLFTITVSPSPRLIIRPAPMHLMAISAKIVRLFALPRLFFPLCCEMMNADRRPVNEKKVWWCGVP